MAGVEVLERETGQVACLHDGRGQLVTASFGVAPLGAHSPGQAIPHELRFTPTERGLYAAAIDLSSGNIAGDTLLDPDNNIVRLSRGHIAEIGSLGLGVVTSDITTMRNVDAKLEKVRDFTLDDLHEVEGLVVELGGGVGVELSSSVSREIAQVDIAHGRIRYWRKRVPVTELGKHIKQGAENHKFQAALATVGVVGAGALALYLKHISNKK